MTDQMTSRSSLCQRAFTRRMHIITAALALLLVSCGAWAQGTSGSLPDPMSSRDLDQVMERLALDDAQRRATEVFHEQYIEEFKQLRDGEIEDFMKKQNAFQGTLPQRKQIEDFVSDRERLINRIARIDNQFFDQVMAVLRDDQQLMLTRLRMNRTRERHGGDMMQMISFLVPSASIDLSTIYERLKLTPDEKLIIQPTVMDYESKLTRSTKEMSDSIMRMFLDALIMLEEAGFDETSFQDPEKAQEAFEFIREAWATLSGGLMAQAVEISDLNRKTCKRIADMLLQENGDRLIVQYFEQAYPELPKSNLRELFRKSLRHKDLTDEQWMNVSVLRDEFRRQEQNLYDDMADIQDKLRSTRSPFDFGGMGGPANVDDEAVDKLADLTERHEKLVERTTDALNVHLGTAMQAKISEMEDPDLTDAIAEAGGDTDEFVETVVVNGDGFGAGSTPGDQPMSVGEFKQTVAMLQLDDANAAVAEQLHAAYVERFTEVSGDVLGKVQEAQSKMWQYDEATQTMNGPTLASVDQIYELRKAAAKAMQDVDDSFFNELVVTAGTDPYRQELIGHLRAIRQRASFTMGRDMWIWGFGGQRSQVASIDLVELCMSERLLDQPSESMRSILTTYNSNMTQAMQSRFVTGLEAQHTMDLTNVQMQAQNREADEVDIAQGVRYQQMIEEVSNKLSEATASVAGINRETLAMLKDALPDEEAIAFEKAYKRKAFPSVYQGAEVIEQTMSKVRALNSLSASQRNSVESLLSEFETKYDTICDKMVGVLDSTSGSLRPFGTDNMREYQRVESTIQKFEFERDELMARTRRRVQDVLSDEQLAQVGGPLARKASQSTGTTP